MRLKRFNEYNNNYHNVEISEEEYDYLCNYGKFIDFSDEDYEKLKIYIDKNKNVHGIKKIYKLPKQAEQFPPRKDEIVNLIEIDFSLYHKEYHQTKIYNELYIYHLEDEFYLVRHLVYNDRMEEGYESFNYRCDEWTGLINKLDEILT